MFSELDMSKSIEIAGYYKTASVKLNSRKSLRNNGRKPLRFLLIVLAEEASVTKPP